MGAITSSHFPPDHAKRLLRSLERASTDENALDETSHRRLDGLRKRLIRRQSTVPVTVLCTHDEQYPASLLDLPDAPKAVYVSGKATLLGRLNAEPAVAVVGARKASPPGREIAYRLGRELASAGVTVVSGMAFGIDAAAHRGALAGNGLTVAVLAGSPGSAYPSAHTGLHRQIADCGLVISEYPPGAKVMKWGFPARNRLIAALAAASVVVEGKRGSGALHTTEFATQLGRMVAAVPGGVISPLSEAPNDLLYDGAHMVRDGRDALELLFGPLAQSELPLQTLDDVDPELRPVLEAIRMGARSPHDVARIVTGVSAAEINLRLGQLELLGRVRRDIAGAYVETQMASL